MTRPLVNKFEQDEAEINKQETAQSDFKETIKQFIGAENSDGALHLEMDFEDAEIDKQILFKNIDSNINDKLFKFTEDSVADNIRMCFNNVPAALISAADNSLFGASGESIAQMREFYQDQTSDERMVLEQVVNQLLKNFTTPQENIKIMPLYAAVVAPVKDPDEARRQAQATLKGSVGGVTALLTIQQSVAAGTTDRSAAIAIITEIYGIDAVKAAEMLGNPKTTTN